MVIDPTSSPTTIRKARLGALDALRFFAAGLVMFFHYCYAGKVLPGFPIYGSVTDAAAGGWVGVQIFFVISGFVIAYSAEGSSAPAFLRSRFLRLWPSILICSVITLFIAVLGGQFGWLTGLQKLLMTWILWPIGAAPWIDGVYWTLVAEVTFYALIFGLLWIRKFERIELFATLLGLVSIVANLANLVWTLPHQGLFTLLLLRHGVHFSLGIFLWLTSMKAVTPWRLVMIAACLVGGGAEIATVAIPKAAPIGWTIAIWAAGAGVVGAAPFVQLSSRLLRWVGLTTYPVYLLHGMVGLVIFPSLIAAGQGKWAALAEAVIVTLALSLLVVFVLEPPLKHLMRRGLDAVAGQSPKQQSGVGDGPGT